MQRQKSFQLTGMWCSSHWCLTASFRLAQRGALHCCLSMLAHAIWCRAWAGVAKRTCAGCLPVAEVVYKRTQHVALQRCTSLHVLCAAFAPPPPLLHRRRAVCLCSTCRRAAVSAAAVCLCSTAAAALLPSLLHRPLCSTAAALLHRRRAARCCCLGPWTSAPPAWLPWKHAVPKE